MDELRVFYADRPDKVPMDEREVVDYLLEHGQVLKEQRREVEVNRKRLQYLKQSVGGV